MRAILVREFGEASVMRLEDVPDRAPDTGEVLVRVRAVGVNPVETYMRAGKHARKPTLPYVPGTDGAGEIEAVGAGVSGFKPGDRVYMAGNNISQGSAGTYAERVICAPTMLHRLPARVTFAQGAAIGVPYATAYRSLFMRAKATPHETLLVHGATGGVGLAAVELARAHGMTVLGTGSTARGLEAVRQRGATTFNHREPDYLDMILAATDGRGVDVILEMAAHLNLDKDLPLLARDGRVVVVGNRGRVEIDPRQTMNRDAAILGMTLFNSPPEELQSIHAAIVKGLEQGTLNPLVGRELPLAEAGKAHEAVLEPGAFGKIVLVP